MTLKESKNIFSNLLNQTNNKYEIKIYKEFIGILDSLKSRNLSEDKMRAVEVHLDLLKLNAELENPKKFYKQRLNDFKKYLKTEFSLITKGYYTAIGMSLGMCFGVAFGSAIEESLGLGMGLTFGMLIGLVVGHYMDKEAITTDRVI